MIYFLVARLLTLLQVHRQVEGRLREHFTQPQVAPPIRASHPRNTTSVDEPEKEIRRRKAEPY